ncbi:MAG: flagellar hook-length control protein FliK [Pseudomonadota bacterium]
MLPRFDAAGVKPPGAVNSPLAAPSATQPVTPPAATPAGAPPAVVPGAPQQVQAAFQRSLASLVGQSLKGEILSKLQDGSFLVKVAGTSARMMLPPGAQVGAEVPLTLISVTPRPTFQIGNNSTQGGAAPQLYTETGLAPGAADAGDAGAARLPSQETTLLPGRPAPGGTGQSAGAGAAAPGTAPATTLPAPTPAAAATPAAPAAPATPATQAAPAAPKDAAGTIAGQGAPPAAEDGAADLPPALRNTTVPSARGDVQGGSSALPGAAARPGAPPAAPAPGTVSAPVAPAADTVPAGVRVPPVVVNDAAPAPAARPVSLGAPLLGKAPLTPAEQLPALDQATPAPSLSPAARAITSALSTAYGTPGATPVIHGKTPLVSGGAPEPGLLAQQLKDALGESGLFYESHVAEWVEGKRSLPELMREPQMQRAAQHALPQTGETLARAALAAPDLAAAQLINQQLHTHEQQRVQWHGEAWPGQPVQWDVRREEGQPRRQDDGDDDAPEALWHSGVRFRFPLLGQVSAAVTIKGGQVHIQVQTDSGDSAAALRAWSGRLQLAMEAAGAPLSSLRIAQDGDAGEEEVRDAE